MGKVEKIEQEVQALSPAELAEFRAWFLEYDWAAWDYGSLPPNVQNLADQTYTRLNPPQVQCPASVTSHR